VVRRLAVLMVAATVAIAACGDDGGDRATFCTTADQLGSDSGLLTGDVTREELDELARIYRELAETAPGAVRDDVQFLRDAVDKLREGDVSFVVDEEQAAKLTDAFEGVSDYLREECPRPQPSTGALRSRPGR
jgi:hypothetical protein